MESVFFADYSSWMAYKKDRFWIVSKSVLRDYVFKYLLIQSFEIENRGVNQPVEVNGKIVEVSDFSPKVYGESGGVGRGEMTPASTEFSLQKQINIYNKKKYLIVIGMSCGESREDKSYRVNGFCQRSVNVNSIKNATDLRGISFNPSFKIKHLIVTSVDDFIKKVTNEIGDYDYQSPVFYRAHADANYLNIPSSLRDKDRINREDFMLQEFERRYPEQFSKCRNTLERLVVMQHYGSFSRCLDVTESPLVALAFVCLDEKKFNKNFDNHKSTYGTITVFKAQNGREDIKGFDSSTVGVLANTAKCEEKFHYGNLEMFYHNDGFGHQLDDFIYFKDIISHSVIVRTKQDNPRIRNQRGAFILVNANEVVDTGRYQCSSLSFMNQIMNSCKGDKPLNLVRLKEKNPNLNLNEWDFKFEKVNPYDKSNKYPVFRSDPFNMKRLYLRDKRTQEQIIFFIPPGCKETIKRQLESLGFTYDFLYPEVDTVFHEIVDKVIK